MPPPADRLLSVRFAVVVTCGLAYFMALGMLLPVLPLFVEGRLGGGNVAIGITVGAFSVGAVALRPIAGRIGDRHGRRPLMIVGASIVAVSTLAYHLSASTSILVLVRILGGVGEAAFFVGAAAMITDLAPESRRGEAISYWSIAVYGGLAFGPSLGEWLLATRHFGRVWDVAAALSIAAALLSLFTRESITVTRDSDGTAVAPPSPLVHRGSVAPGIVLFSGMVGLAGFSAFVPLYVLEIGLKDSRGVFLLYGCLIMAIRVIGARIPDRLGPTTAGTAAIVTGAAGLLVIALFPNPAGLFAGTAVFAAGMSLLYPAMLTLALVDVTPTQRSSAVGTISSFFDLSQGLGAIILGAAAALSGYRGSFVVAAVIAVAGLAVLRTGSRVEAHADPVEQA